MEKKNMEEKNAKIAVRRDAEEALNRMVAVANDGFKGGRITKHQLASWIIGEFESYYFKKSISKIQRDNFDRLAYLKNVTKEMKSSGSNFDSVKFNELLSPLLSKKPKRKATKGSADKSAQKIAS